MIKNSASETPVVPERYKPAEGPGLITRLRYMGGRLRSELNDAAMLYPTCFHLEAVQQMIAEWDEIAKEAVKTEMAAATPVTVEAPPKLTPDLNDPRYCGACKHIHPLGEVACRCYCDRVDCPECSKRIAARVMAPELAREIDKYYQVFEETPEDQRIAAVSEIILGRRFEELKQVSAQPPCSECATRSKEVEKAQQSRKHTQDWYAGRYGKLEDWARKILPEPYCTQFFSCIANGTYDAVKDVGEPYMSKVGLITPSGYIKFSTAQEQILHDQTTRAEEAELECTTLREKLEIAQRYGQREYAIEQILRGDLATAVTECATLRKERDDYRHKWNDVLIHEDAALKSCRSLTAQLSTLRDALEREKLAAELFSRHRMRNNGRTRNEAAQLPMWQLMSAYERQNWLDTAADVQNIISAALAPTPEVAPKEGKS